MLILKGPQPNTLPLEQLTADCTRLARVEDVSALERGDFLISVGVPGGRESFALGSDLGELESPSIRASAYPIDPDRVEVTDSYARPNASKRAILSYTRGSEHSSASVQTSGGALFNQTDFRDGNRYRCEADTETARYLQGLIDRDL